MSAPDVTGAMTLAARRAQDYAADRERDAVLADVRRELAEAAASLVSSEIDDYMVRYYDWLRTGKSLSGQPRKPAIAAADVGAIVKERVTDRTLALRANGRAA